jgi:hypothetical protein
MSSKETAEVILIVIKRIAKWIIFAVLGIVAISIIIWAGSSAIDYLDTLENEKLALREENARACIAKDIGRMEKLVKQVLSVSNEDDTMPNLKKKIDNLLSKNGNIVPDDNDIKKSVLIYQIDTKCDSEFNFLINANAKESGELSWVKVWATNAPKGYLDGYHNELSKDFDLIKYERKIDEAREAENAAIEKKQREYEKNRSLRIAQQKEDEQKRLMQEKWRLEHLPSSSVNNTKLKNMTASEDPCAMGLGMGERLSRLSRFGTVRQTSQYVYTAGEHRISFDFMGQLSSCW